MCIYLPMIAELPVAMLACARIGAVHSVVFAGFSAESLAQRIEDCKCNVILTCNGDLVFSDLPPVEANLGLFSKIEFNSR